jgi:hypothetical protein
LVNGCAIWRESTTLLSNAGKHAAIRLKGKNALTDDPSHRFCPFDFPGLEPIEKPKGLMMRIAYWMTRRQFGKVMTLMTLEIARRRGSLRLTYEIGKFELKRSGSNVASETPLWRLASSTNREQVCKGSRSNICDRLFSSCDSMGNRLFYILDSGWTKSLYYLWA